MCYRYTTRHSVGVKLVPKAGLEPARAKRPTVFETVASANSATSAAVDVSPVLRARSRFVGRGVRGAEDEGRTRDLLLGKEALYH